MSDKRNRNKKNWKRRRRRQPQRSAVKPRRLVPPRSAPLARLASQPSELDQVGAMIVEEELGLPRTSLADLRAICRTLPDEPTLLLLAMLAGRVEATRNNPIKHLEVAEWFY